MGVTELSNKLGIDKSVVSRLAAKGMPTSSADAANAWRAQNAKPRRKKGARSSVPVVTSARFAPQPLADETVPIPPKPAPTPDPVAEQRDSDPRDSVKMARLAEKAAWNRFASAQKNPQTSPEEFRRINGAYIAARANRMKAESDYREWRRQEGITLFLSEAQDIIARPHVAARQTMQSAPKNLAARLHNQPQKVIEQTLAEFFDRLMALIQQGI